MTSESETVSKLSLSDVTIEASATFIIMSWMILPVFVWTTVMVLTLVLLLKLHGKQ